MAKPQIQSKVVRKTDIPPAERDLCVEDWRKTSLKTFKKNQKSETKTQCRQTKKGESQSNPFSDIEPADVRYFLAVAGGNTGQMKVTLWFLLVAKP